MKIGVISDTHMPGNAKALPARLCAELKGCDMVIHVGDMVTAVVAQDLKKICPNLKAVYGNMDPAEVRKQFPEKEVIPVGKFRIGIKHGYGPPEKLLGLMGEAFKDDNVDMIIFGHSHNPLNQKIGKIIFFNPGSPTDEIFAPYKSFGIIEINDKIEAKIVKL
jgi:uncharacterized protein